MYLAQIIRKFKFPDHHKDTCLYLLRMMKTATSVITRSSRAARTQTIITTVGGESDPDGEVVGEFDGFTTFIK